VVRVNGLLQSLESQKIQFMRGQESAECSYQGKELEESNRQINIGNQSANKRNNQKKLFIDVDDPMT